MAARDFWDLGQGEILRRERCLDGRVGPPPNLSAFGRYAGQLDPADCQLVSWLRLAWCSEDLYEMKELSCGPKVIASAPSLETKQSCL